jgi:hypothetical protein
VFLAHPGFPNLAPTPEVDIFADGISLASLPTEAQVAAGNPAALGGSSFLSAISSETFFGLPHSKGQRSE